MNQSTTAEQFSEDSGSGSSWRLFTFLLVIFSVILLSWIGLNVGYRAYLNSSIAGLNEKIAASSDRLNIEDEKDLITFYSQTINLKDILKNHIFASKTFPFLESTTHTRVAYTSIGLDVPKRELTIDGLAGSFETLVQQLSFWQQREEIESVFLTDNSTTNELVRFGVNIVFKKEFFLYSDSYLPKPFGGASPSSNQPAQ